MYTRMLIGLSIVIQSGRFFHVTRRIYHEFRKSSSESKTWGPLLLAASFHPSIRQEHSRVASWYNPMMILWSNGFKRISSLSSNLVTYLLRRKTSSLSMATCNSSMDVA